MASLAGVEPSCLPSVHAGGPGLGVTSGKVAPGGGDGPRTASPSLKRIGTATCVSTKPARLGSRRQQRGDEVLLTDRIWVPSATCPDPRGRVGSIFVIIRVLGDHPEDPMAPPRGAEAIVSAGPSAGDIRCSSAFAGVATSRPPPGQPESNAQQKHRSRHVTTEQRGWLQSAGCPQPPAKRWGRPRMAGATGPLVDGRMGQGRRRHRAWRGRGSPCSPRGQRPAQTSLRWLCSSVTDAGAHGATPS